MTPKTMKAIPLTKHGKPAVLEVKDTAIPEPGKGEVRVKIETIGINYAEILSRKGLYGWVPKLPYIPGMEAYGQIDALGQNVETLDIGEPVIVGAQYGCYAEYIVIDQQQALPAIPFYSAEENAAFAVNYMTAWISLFEMARIRPSDTVLVQAAAGGVGTAAVQLSKRYGCTVYGTTGNSEKVRLLNKLGIDAAIHYRNRDFEQTIKEMTQHQGVDVILELVGGDVYKKSLRIIRPLGRIVVAGFASLDYQRWNPVSLWRAWRAIPRARITHMAAHSYGVMASHVGYLLNQPKRIRKLWDDLVNYVTEHKIHPVIGGVYPLDDIPKAHQWIESRQSYGKVVAKTLL